MIAERHGMSRTPEYKAWEKMKARCADKSNPRYGGRGIDVCQQWKDSFSCFYRDVGPRPSKDHSIERINNDLGYFPENCKWATNTEQLNNTCRNRPVSAFGETMSVSMWSRKIGISKKTLWNRLFRSKMLPEEALVNSKWQGYKK